DILRRLAEENDSLPEHYPKPTLELVDAVVGDEIELREARYLDTILREIAKAAPSLASESRFVRLQQLTQRFE
ncbi:MAG: hypothetical protein ACRD9L_14495, partial [Bryobacteraceae bacterium]